MAVYSLTIKQSAAKELKGIADNTTLSRIIDKIQSLAEQPRPSGSERLTGRPNVYRIRQGDYRVIYSIDDAANVVDVIKIGHRREVYR